MSDHQRPAGDIADGATLIAPIDCRLNCALVKADTGPYT